MRDHDTSPHETAADDAEPSRNNPGNDTMAPPTSAKCAIDEIRVAAGRDTAPSGEDFVIGTVGQDVPVEVIEAFGAAAVRLRGNPAWDTAPADHYLGRGLDPAIRSLMAGILAERFGRLDAIVVSSDCDASQRLYYVLREIRRVDPAAPIPPVHLVDILHLPRESTSRYNLVRVRQFVDVLERWTGTRADAPALERAVAAHDRRRALQRAVMALRRTVLARLSGTDALAVIAAADRMPRDRYEECLAALVNDADALEPVTGTRVFLSGSNHDRDGVYRAIEASGAVIVGEDHDHGELVTERDILGDRGAGDQGTGDRGAETDILDAIARRYQYNGPTAQRASIGERASHAASGVARSSAELLLSYVRVMDEAPLWDFAAQRTAAPVPAGVVLGQEYGAIDRDALERALARPNETGVNA